MIKQCNNKKQYAVAQQFLSSPKHDNVTPADAISDKIMYSQESTYNCFTNYKFILLIAKFEKFKHIL